MPSAPSISALKRRAPARGASPWPLLRALSLVAALAALPCVARAGVAGERDGAPTSAHRARTPARVVALKPSPRAGGAREGAPRAGVRGVSPGVTAAARPDASARVRRVVVDPGHGGRDTGAIGPTGVLEKDVALAIARRLAHGLEERGYQVVLTRRDDRYVPLPERTALAQARDGDLFVSVHANADRRPDRKGIETFVATAGARGNVIRAARERGGDRAREPSARRGRAGAGSRAAGVTAAASSRLAALVQRETCAALRGRAGGERDRGVKGAPYFVLVNARMPAVLVETSFITNRSGERRLSDPRFQERVAAGIARAVAAFGREPVAAAGARASPGPGTRSGASFARAGRGHGLRRPPSRDFLSPPPAPPGRPSRRTA